MKLRPFLPLACLSMATVAQAQTPPIMPPGSYSAKVATAYQHTHSPFSASVGICQETDNQTTQQIDKIATDFKMVHIYQYNTAMLDKAQSKGMEVLLGTLISKAESFTTMANATAYVQNDIMPYKDVIKAINLGNEPNLVATYIDPTTFTTAINNLTAALQAASLDIPVTTNLVYGATVSAYPPDAVTFQPYSSTPDGDIYSPIPYIQAVAAANTNPFIFFDLYPNLAISSSDLLPYGLFEAGGGPNNECCGMFDAQYLSACNATYAVNTEIEIYIAETGWPNANGNFASSANQAAFVNNFFKQWVAGQNNETVPVFLFYAYGNMASNAQFALLPNTSIDFLDYKRATGLASFTAATFGAWASEVGVADNPLGDTDMDGNPEFIEYAFELDPNQADSPAAPTALVSGNYTFTFQRPVTAFTVEYSYDLDAWHPVNETPAETTNTLSYDLESLASANGDKVFARVTVSE